MITENIISDLSQLWALISNQPKDLKTNRFRSDRLYRGISDKKYKLTTSLTRCCGSLSDELEESILRNFAKYAIMENPSISKSIWLQMIVGQHHGLPTRLMDWSYSPLVALHFATATDSSILGTRDAAVWEISINEFNKKLPCKYKALLKSENAYLFTVDMLHSLTEPRIIKKRPFDEVLNYDKCMKSNCMVLLEPPSIDQRIISQYSYFSVVPKDLQDLESYFKKEPDIHAIKHIISMSLVWRIRDFLDSMNINERTLLPDLDGLACWLKRHYYVSH